MEIIETEGEINIHINIVLDIYRQTRYLFVFIYIT